MLAIRLPEELEQRLSHLAKVTGRTKTFYACEAMEQRALGVSSSLPAFLKIVNNSIA